MFNYFSEDGDYREPEVNFVYLEKSLPAADKERIRQALDGFDDVEIVEVVTSGSDYELEGPDFFDDCDHPLELYWDVDEKVGMALYEPLD